MRDPTGEAVYFQDSKILVLHPTKTGGSTIEHYLMKTLKDSVTPHAYADIQYLNKDSYHDHHDIKLKVMTGNFHDGIFYSFTLQHACLITARRLMGDAAFESARKVTTVRNPYTRLVSQFFFYGLDKQYSFLEYVRDKLPESMEISAEIALNHAARQTMYTHLDGVQVADLILRQEDMRDAVSKLSAFIGMPIEYDEAVQLRRSRASELPDYMAVYDDESRAIVRDLYREDFELLGYEP